MPGLVRLLRHDVVLEMPPDPGCYQGLEEVHEFFDSRFAPIQARGEQQFTMCMMTANGQPAAAGYMLSEDGLWHRRGIQVLTVTATGISHIVSFNELSLFDSFGLPAVLDVAGRLIP